MENMKRRRELVVRMMEMPTGGASDMALKMDVQTIRSSLIRLRALRPVTWHKAEQGHDDDEYGFVAKEVEELLPQFVSHRTDADQTYLSTKEMIPMLVAAIQEQQKQIEVLGEKLRATLENLPRA